MMNLIGVPEKKKKKPPKNAYYFFMMEFKRNEEARGRSISLCEAQALASEPWQQLTLEEKKKYSDLATLDKQARRGDPNMKFTSLGVPFAVVDAEEKKAREKEMIIEATIKNEVGELDDSSIRTHKFYFCHVNYYFKYDGKHRPAEIALVEFNLQGGITNTYHKILHPGELPLGSRRQAMERTNEVHGIRLPDGQTKGVVESYRKVFLEILQFVSPNKRTEPIYTMIDNENNNSSLVAVEDALEFLAEYSDQPSTVFRVFPLTKLFFELKNKCAESRSDTDKFPSLGIVEGVIEKDVFSYASGLGCDYHESDELEVGIGPINCSLSIATRWVYTVCDHCCKLLRIRMSLGDHCPKEVDVSWEKNKQDVTKKMAGLSVQEIKKLKEERTRQFDEQKKKLEETKEARPPTGLRDADQPGGAFNSSDFPQLGASSRMTNAWNSDQPVYWPTTGRGRGRGAREN